MNDIIIVRKKKTYQMLTENCETIYLYVLWKCYYVKEEVYE
jgi:hypothetical protein